jgi:hypothetical protein
LLEALRARRAGASERPGPDPTAPDVLALDDITPQQLFDGGDPAEVLIDPQPGDVLAVLRRLGPLPGPFGDAAPDVQDAVERAAGAAWELLAGSRTGTTDDRDAGR